MSTDDLKGWPKWALIAGLLLTSFISITAVGALVTFAVTTVVNTRDRTEAIDKRVSILESERAALIQAVQRIEANTEVLRDTAEEVKRDVAVLKARS